MLPRVAQLISNVLGHHAPPGEEPGAMWPESQGVTSPRRQPPRRRDVDRLPHSHARCKNTKKVNLVSKEFEKKTSSSSHPIRP